MDGSPAKKKLKVQSMSDLKRPIESSSSPSKRRKNEEENSTETNVTGLRRTNFITACKSVSFTAYSNVRSRFQLIYLPECTSSANCKHQDPNMIINPVPRYAEESFKIEMNTNMWYEALEVCQLCITPHQYLTANILQDIIEIMLNAHSDEDSPYTIVDVLESCQQVLSQQFLAHPPCISKKIRKCYRTFLTSPMSPKDKTFSNRSEFGFDKGIIVYCFNRLINEMSHESKDGPLIDKYENIPQEMQKTVKGLHWQKEKFEIYEVLDRTERIERLFAIMESVVQLLQYDLAIWHSRHTKDQGVHMMRSHKPLMAYVLWPDNVLFTGAVTNNCKLILRLFVLVIHVGYPNSKIDIMSTWLNAIVQTIYICETNSNSDYPNCGKYSNTFAREFLKIIEEICPEKCVSIIGKIKPTYMQYLVVMTHIKTLLGTNEEDVFKILSDFLKKESWKKYPENHYNNEQLPEFKRKPRRILNLVKYVTRKCNEAMASYTPKTDMSQEAYPKSEMKMFHNKFIIDRKYVTQMLYIAVQAFIHSYNVSDIYESWEKLNSQTSNDSNNTSQNKIDYSIYHVSENFIKKLRSVFKNLVEVVTLLKEIKKNNKYEYLTAVFSNVDLLGVQGK